MAWLFRSSEPIADRLRKTSSEEWVIEQHHSLISPGDVVFFWEGGSDGRVVGVGRIQTQAYRWPTDMRKFAVRVGHNLVLSSPVSTGECLADPILHDLPVISHYDQANYGLSKAHADRLLAAIGAREPGLAKALNLRPDRIPALEETDGEQDQPVEPQPTPSPDVGLAEQEVSLWDETDRSVLATHVKAFRADRLNEATVALQRIAHAHLRQFLTPEVLADVTTDEFEAQVLTFGSVTLEGETVDLAEAADRLKDVPVEEIAKRAEAGLISVHGNLTWVAGGEQSLSVGDEGGGALRLRAGLQHLLNEKRPLSGRVDRMRRSAEALWPEAATGILMVTRPEEFVVFDNAANRALRALGVKRTLRSTVEDYERYLRFVSRIEETFGLGSRAHVSLFLHRLADPERAVPSATSVAGEAVAAPVPTEKGGASPDASPVSSRAHRVAAETDRSRVDATEGQAIFALYQRLRHQGVIISLGQAINIYLSLKTVPVVVLAGAPGSGKNFTLRAFAEQTGARFHQLPVTNETGVGPANSPIRFREMLGQPDYERGVFRPEPLLDALLDAQGHPDATVIVGIDTPDGWQEESWLLEYLRLEDTRRLTNDGAWVTSSCPVVPGHDVLTTTRGETIAANLSLPDNLFLVFSPVGLPPLGDVILNRANVVDMGMPDLSLDAARPGHAPEGTTSTGLGRMLVERRNHRDLQSILHRSWVDEWNSEIVRISAMLEPMDLAVGYRLRDDILRYLAYADDLNGQLPYGMSFPLETAFDHQFVQRILPRVLPKEPDEETVTELILYAQGGQGGERRFPKAYSHLEWYHRQM